MILRVQVVLRLLIFSSASTCARVALSSRKLAEGRLVLKISPMVNAAWPRHKPYKVEQRRKTGLLSREIHGEIARREARLEKGVLESNKGLFITSKVRHDSKAKFALFRRIAHANVRSAEAEMQMLE